jgi:uncharacterized protein (DUF1800 family)
MIMWPRSAFLVVLAAGWGEGPAVGAPPERKFKPAITVRSGLPESRQWDGDMAAHLFRRAGFGGTPAQIAYLAGMSREEAVEYLINFDRISHEAIPITVEPQGRRERRAENRNDAEVQRQVAERMQRDRQQLQEIIGWWIKTMVTTPRPLQEKLVLYWHGHFTSGFREVKSSRAMFIQNKMFREHAAGNFRDLLIAVTHDPAMIVYLNTNQNRKGKPNENYARELMELFTMGPGRYSEQDIKEAARAFTGIGIDVEEGTSVFRPRAHDDGVKTFLGRSGDFGANEIIDIILAQPATAEFMATRFWSFFAYDDPEPRVVKALAQVLRDGRYELKPLLKAMFMCDAFYSGRARFTHVKSPVELLVGTMRMLEIPAVDGEALNFGLRAMGQQLFQPPNVKGWDGGLAWINTSTLYNRYNVVCALIEGNDNDRARQRRSMMRRYMQATVGREGEPMMADEVYRPQPAYDPLPVVRENQLQTADAIVDYYIMRLLQRPIAPERRAAIVEVFMEELKRIKGRDDREGATIRGLIKLITSTPEYQLS